MCIAPVNGCSCSEAQGRTQRGGRGHGVFFPNGCVIVHNKSQISSIEFVINRLFMKIFDKNIEIVKCSQQEFCFSPPSVTLAHRTENFLGKIRQCENRFVKRLLRM